MHGANYLHWIATNAISQSASGIYLSVNIVQKLHRKKNKQKKQCRLGQLIINERLREICDRLQVRSKF